VRLSWIVYSEAFDLSPLVRGTKLVDDLYLTAAEPLQRSGMKFVLTDERLKHLRCDLFVNLSPYGNRGLSGSVLREIVLARALGATKAIGMKLNSCGRRGILNQVQHSFVRNEPRRVPAVLREIGIEGISYPDILPKDSAARERMLKALSGFPQGRPMAVCNVGAKFEVKKWPAEKFRALCLRLVDHLDLSVVIVGLEAEREAAEEIARQNPTRIVNLAGRTSLPELFELLRLARLCITNDTGTLHVATMIGVPTVALFTTRLSVTHWFPRGKNISAIFAFSPSTYSYNDDDAVPDALADIPTDEVFSAASRRLRAQQNHNT